MLELTISDKEKIHVALNPNDTLDGVPVWAVRSGQSTVIPDPDGMGAYLVSEDDVTEPRETVYEVTADADMGAGVTALTDQVTLRVTETQATTLGLHPSSPEPK